MRERRGLTVAVAVVLPLVVLAIGAWQYRWMSDDGFINLRVVKQIEAGNGPVFNAGERVEAGTSPLWLAVLTVGDVFLPLRLEWVAVLSGIAATLAGVALMLFGTMRLLAHRAADALLVPTGIWLLVAFPAMWKFSSSGLENGLFTLWFGASFFLLASWAATMRETPSTLTAVVLGLGPLVRPDVAVIAGCLLVAVAVVARQRVRFLVAALAIPVLYQLFRMGYYDSLVPNTALAKEASRSWWSPGLRYVRDAGRPYWMWIPLLAVAIGGYLPLVRGFLHAHDRRRFAIVAGCVAGGLLHLVYVARVGGDFMHARMVLPGLTALVAPVAVTPVARHVPQYVMPAIVCGWALVSLVALRSYADAPITFIGSPRNAVTLEDYGWQEGGPFRQGYEEPGVYWLAQPVDAPPRAGLPATTLANFGVGVSGYAFGPEVHVLDMLGLGDAFTSHLELRQRGVVAHEKPLPRPWVAARLFAPGANVSEADLPLPEFFVARPLDRPIGSFDQRVDAAQRALECGQLRAFMDRVEGGLSPGEFLGNVWHSFGDTRLRIPPEPADAVAKFCD